MFFAELGVLGIIRAEFFFWGGGKRFILRLVTGVVDIFGLYSVSPWVSFGLYFQCCISRIFIDIF